MMLALRIGHRLYYKHCDSYVSKYTVAADVDVVCNEYRLGSNVEGVDLLLTSLMR